MAPAEQAALANTPGGSELLNLEADLKVDNRRKQSNRDKSSQATQDQIRARRIGVLPQTRDFIRCGAEDKIKEKDRANQRTRLGLRSVTPLPTGPESVVLLSPVLDAYRR